ncbi:MAG: FkbM family methyltransferase [Dehalococcoidia bacterium]|jgi:FkbM family methyltransferase|nr:FkbM family methyltransferase [Dehalococcoidia bacterium]
MVYRYLGLFGLVTAVYFAIVTAVARALGVKTLKRRVFNYRLYLDTGDRGLSRTLFLFGKREIDHYKMLQGVLEPGMQILDIGANIGYYAMMESLVIGPDGRVTAIEPMLPNIEMLKRNIELNGATNIDVVHGAVSASTGTGQMYMSSHSNLHTFHRDGSASAYLESTPVDVPTMTLRDAAARAGNCVDLVRMDVEGHEVEILGQLVDLAGEGVIAPRVIFETHLSRYTRENDFVPVLNGLFSLGYTVRSAASSSESGTNRLQALGYAGSEPFYSDFGTRSIFSDIGNEHAVDLICRTGGLRTVMLEKQG